MYDPKYVRFNLDDGNFHVHCNSYDIRDTRTICQLHLPCTLCSGTSLFAIPFYCSICHKRNGTVPRKRYERRTSMETACARARTNHSVPLQHHESYRNWLNTRQTRFCNNKTISPNANTANNDVDLMVYTLFCNKRYYCYIRSINSRYI